MDERDLMDLRARVIALEAKVDYLYQHLAITFTPTQAFRDERLAKVYEAVAKGDMIGAVRIHREQFNSSLVDAKNAVDALKAGLSK
jgi:ribosomal protein L7/L12